MGDWTTLREWTTVMFDPTAEAFANPLPGDRFQEMYSYWLYVIWRKGDVIATLESAAPCLFPRDGELWIGTVEDFRDRWGHTWEGRTTYGIMLADRGNNVTGWLRPFKESS